MNLSAYVHRVRPMLALPILFLLAPPAAWSENWPHLFWYSDSNYPAQAVTR